MVGFVRGSMFRAWLVDGRGSLPGAVAGREPRSEVTDERGSAARESESIGESNSAAKFESESESGSSLRRFFPDMGKKWEWGEREPVGENETCLV